MKINDNNLFQNQFLKPEIEHLGVINQPLRPGGIVLTKTASELCGFTKDSLILDAGCGYGITTQFLYDQYGISAVGIDISIEKLNSVLQQLFSNEPVIRKLVCSKIPFIPFKSDSFNAIFCECVLSLIADKQKALQEFYRILKRDGKLIISDLYINESLDNGHALSGTTNNETCRDFHIKYEILYKEDSLTSSKNYEIKNLYSPSSCVDGAVQLSYLKQLIESMGFKIQLLEDHTKLLKEFAGQMVFDNNRMYDNTLSEVCRLSCLKLGYCMVIAGKV